ncbi:hypothetical protein MKW98_000844 [Papaver atlanticum]|uniref:WAT1-related protein n=1 Tax=Papaver atlanticum TaxID=357466 RepID=A0AAD4XCI4_9MAGN|nr:hypothetical protein MKW98_000844 [Papaver atlanticum]
MTVKLCVLWRTYCRKFKPHLLMVLAHMCFTFLYFITEAAFNHGMNPHVCVTYRHVVSGLAVLPFAYFLERNVRLKLTLALFAEIFAPSLIGICLTLNMYFLSMKYTSPTFIASMINTVASLTLVIAVVLRLEVLDIRSSRGMAKILGTSVSFAGVLTMTLFKGPAVINLWGALIRIERNSVEHENWLKGSLLAVASCITWSVWYIMQAVTLKKYPAQVSLTAWMSILGAAQSAVLTAFVEHGPKAWAIGINVELWAIIYALRMVYSGLIIYVQLRCTEQKGPVFVTMFDPLSTLMVAVVAYFIHHGGVIIVAGLYLVLWSKEGDNESQTDSQVLTNLS